MTAEWGRIHQPAEIPIKRGSSFGSWGPPRNRRRILSRVSADWSRIVFELLPRNLFHLHIRMSKRACGRALPFCRRRPFPIRIAKSALRYYAARGSLRHPVYTPVAPSSSCILPRFAPDMPSFNASSFLFFL